MYEDITYDLILNRMLKRIPDEYDKREGSIIMNALAPAATEIFISYMELDRIMSETFADTQSRDFLILRAKERGIVPKAAVPCVWRCYFDVPVKLSDRFAKDEFSFFVSEVLEDGYSELTCEQAGAKANLLYGDLLPLQFVQNLTEARLETLIKAGEDEESTEDLRARYFDFLKEQSFGGNIAAYKEEALLLDGVSAVKVIPNHQGAGTVKMILVGAGNKAPSQEFINEVQNIFDPEPSMGMGISPIGHVCTVEAVKTLLVNFNLNISLAENTENIELEISEKIEEYLFESIDSWGEKDEIVLRVSQIEAKILEIKGVIDIFETRINGETRTLTIPFDTIPTKGDINAQFT